MNRRDHVDECLIYNKSIKFVLLTKPWRCQDVVTEKYLPFVKIMNKTVSLSPCSSWSCARLIYPVYQTPPVTTRQCVGLCTQKPGSFTRSWRRLRVPKRWVLTFVVIMVAGFNCHVFRHVKCALEDSALWLYRTLFQAVVNMTLTLCGYRWRGWWGHICVVEL